MKRKNSFLLSAPSREYFWLWLIKIHEIGQLSADLCAFIRQFVVL